MCTFKTLLAVPSEMAKETARMLINSSQTSGDNWTVSYRATDPTAKLMESIWPATLGKCTVGSTCVKCLNTLRMST